MKRLFIILATCSIAMAARAEVYVYTNVITSLSPSAHPLTFSTPYLARYTVYLRNAGGTALSNMTDYTFSWQITDARDGVLRGTFPVEIVDPTNARIQVEASFADWEPGQYRGKIFKYIGETNYDGYVADDWISLQSECLGCPPDVSIGDVSVTNNITVSIVSTTVIDGVSVVFTALVENTFALTMYVTNFVTVTQSIYNSVYVTNQLDNITEQISNNYTNFVSPTNILAFVTVSTNAAGEVVIDLGDGGFQRIYQVDDITNFVFTGIIAGSENSVILWIATDTHTIEYNTSPPVVWVEGASPTQDTEDDEYYGFRFANANKGSGAYLEDD